MTIGGAIKREREKAGLNQTEFGKKAGVTQPTVSEWENDKTMPDGIQLIKIATALKVPIQAIAHGIDEDYDRLCRELIRGGLVVESTLHAIAHTGGAHVAAHRPAPDDPEIHRIAVRLAQISKGLRKHMADIAEELSTYTTTLARRQAAIARQRRSSRAGSDRKIR